MPLPPAFADAPVRYLGIAPFLKASIEGADLRAVAQALLQQAEQAPDNAALWMNLSTAFFTLKEDRLGLAMQRHALQHQRQFELPAAQQPPRCRVLLLTAEGDLAENTPLDCLIAGGAVDLCVYYLQEPEPKDGDAVPEHDVLMVGFSHTSKNRALLERLSADLARWPRPVVNLPQHIPNVERAAASVLLQDAPGVAMPITHQADRAALERVARDQGTLADLGADLAFPLIVRPLDSHAGNGLEKIDNASALARYLAAAAPQDAAFYLSRFIDYRSADGQYRKYRVVLIDGQPFAGHMAVSSHWMIHYVNAGMYEDAAKRAEEADFMARFSDFAARHGAALAAIHQRIKLDYLGVDCAETPDGRLLVFEVDHAMVVHDMDTPALFPYKQAPMHKVRQAFEDYLCTRMN